MVVHGQQAEQVVVVLGDRLAGPVLVDRADLELLVIATELHGISSIAAANDATESAKWTGIRQRKEAAIAVSASL